MNGFESWLRKWIGTRLNETPKAPTADKPTADKPASANRREAPADGVVFGEQPAEVVGDLD